MKASPLARVTLVVAMASAIACSSSGGSGTGGAALQSSCVRDQLNLRRDLADGEECKNIGYADCGSGYASECLGSCAFDVCQSKPCTSDAECPGACKDYVVSDVSYGKWCDGKTCTHGTIDCPCDQGSCTPPDEHYEVTCNAKGICEGSDTCASGCRVRTPSGVSLCCGGTLCSGSCVGTPCCQ